MKIAPPQDREEHLIDKLAVPSSARRSVAIHEGRTRSSAAIRALTDQRHSTACDRQATAPPRPGLSMTNSVAPLSAVSENQQR